MDERAVHIMFENARTWAEVDLDAVAHNIAEAKKLMKPGVKLAAVLKADAYGLGAKAVAGIMVENGADMLAVACVPEAVELREKYSRIPILVLGYTPTEWAATAVENEITLTVFSPKEAEAVSKAAHQMNKYAKIHIKIDTGFNRLGFRPGQEALDEIAWICRLPNLIAEGIFTHLALNSKDDDARQFALFEKALGRLEKMGVTFPLRHVCDSIGMVRYPEYQLDMVRPGAFLYGVRPSRFNAPDVTLKMPLAFKTRVSQVKTIESGEGVGYDFTFVAHRRTVIGTLAAGYVDGYMRCLSNKGEVLIRGRRAPVVGLVCMDQCMVDLTDIPGVLPGDEALLFGESSQGAVTLEEVSQWAGTNRNEVLSGIGRRVPRIYLKDSQVAGTADYLSD